MDKPALLVFADDWGRHPSSCQHLLRRLREHFRVLWVNSIGTRQVKANAVTLSRALEKLTNWCKGVKQVSDQMWVVDLPMLPGSGNKLVRALNRHIVTVRLAGILSRLRMQRPVVLTTLPYINWLIRDIPRSALIYYCTDDYSHWPSADRETLQQADRDLSQQADLILAASQALLRSHESTGRCLYFPHGVDFAHFASSGRTKEIPPEVQRIPGPRIGFFGLIYEKLNFDLLGALAQRFAHANLVMIGPIAYCPAAFSALPNVHLLGPRPYEELPKYIGGLDALLLPYVDDPMIRQSGPLKLRECLASGKPTISIDVPEVRLLQPHVRIGRSTEEFLDQVSQALAEAGNESAIEARQDSVREDGWDYRAEFLRDQIHSLLGGRILQEGTKAIPSAKLPRVLHLRTISGKGGGPEKTLLNSPRFLKDSYEVRLAYIRPENDAEYDMPARAAALGVDLVDIPERTGFAPHTVWRLWREIEEFRPDILHAHDYKTNVLSLMLGRCCGICVITTLHGYVTRGGRLEAYYHLDRCALKGMDHLVAVSEDLYKMCVDLGIPRSRCSLIENAIDTNQYRRTRSAAEAKAKLGIDPGRLVVGAVGRLSAEKGFDILLRAAAELLNAGLDVQVVIAGEGPERSRLEALSDELGCAERVALLGHRIDIPLVFEAMDAFALSSLREGLPNVLLEAMAFEVPVATTRLDGLTHLVEADRNALVVEPADVPGLAQALARLLTNKELSTRIAKAGRTMVESRYSFAARMQKIRALYDRLLGRSPRVSVESLNGTAHATAIHTVV